MKILFLHNAFIFMCYNNSYLFLSFHNKLKTNPCYLNDWANRRCNDLIEVLFTIEEDMFFEWMRKKVMLSPKDASLKAKGEQRHAHGKQILNSMIDVSYTSNTITSGSAKCQLFYKNTNSGGIEQCVQGCILNWEQKLYYDNQYQQMRSTSVHSTVQRVRMWIPLLPYCSMYMCRLYSWAPLQAHRQGKKSHI